MKAGASACVVLLLAGTASFVWSQQNAGSAAGELEVEHVQGNVYMIAGAGGNIVFQTGPQGTLVVDSGLAGTSERVLKALGKVTDKPIQYIINTSADPEYAGGNASLRKAGISYTGDGAQIYAQDNVMVRMSRPGGAEPGNWPTMTFFVGRKQMYFNDEPIEIIYQPSAHSDADSFVFFRRSDVIAAGDIFLTTTYPVIDLEHGGSIQGELDALNNLVDMAVVKHEAEGGTYIVPGHGRIADQFDLVEYRDMVTIVRDRIQAAIKKGMTLQQVKSAGLTLDYDYRYGAKSGPGTTDRFVESVYSSLTKGAKP